MALQPRLDETLSGDLLSDDWRGPTLASDVPKRAEQATAQPKLYRNARPSTLAAERARATDIVRHAKAAVETTFRDVRLGRAITSGVLTPIVESIAASIARNPIAIPSVIRLKAQHEYTYLHSIAVCGLMIALARELRLDEGDLHDIGMAGLMHDIGKARMPTMLLDKAGPLTTEEFAVLRSHTQRGVDLMARSGGFPAIALDVCAHHHVRLDGSGYPPAPANAPLSIHARISAVCDVYDAITSARPYKPAWSQGEALEWMASKRGQFDNAVFEAFRRMIAIFPVGAMVRLHSERLAIVLDDPAADPVSPPVGIFHCASSRRALAWRRIDSARDPIVAVEQPERWQLADWPAQRAAMLAAL